MIHVLASISVREGKMSEMMDIYQSFVPQVEAEKGCLMYLPAIDQLTNINNQTQDENMVTVIEKWEDIATFNAHLSAPHVIIFREKIKDIVTNVSIKVLRNGLS